jgi:hypothetical protein
MLELQNLRQMALVVHSIEFPLIGSSQMSQFETSVPLLTVQNSNVRHILRRACIGLAYLGIVATFAIVAFTGWVISLLIW